MYVNVSSPLIHSCLASAGNSSWSVHLIFAGNCMDMWIEQSQNCSNIVPFTEGAEIMSKHLVPEGVDDICRPCSFTNLQPLWCPNSILAFRFWGKAAWWDLQPPVRWVERLLLHKVEQEQSIPTKSQKVDVPMERSWKIPNVHIHQGLNSYL